MIVAIGGPPGSGKTTVAERWAFVHGYDLISAGTRFRAMAKARAMTLEALGRAAELDPAIDRALDSEILEEVNAKTAAGANVVVDGRIQAYLLSRRRIPCLKVLIDAPLEVRADRVAKREGKRVADAKREILAREASERIRYKRIYGIDLRDTSVFDLVIDSGERSPDEIVSIIAARVRG